MRLGKARSFVAISLALLLSPGAFIIPARAEQVVAWNSTTSYPLTVSGHSCVTSSGYIYCVGGSRGSPPQFYDSVYYAPLNSSGVGAWSKTTSYPTKVTGESCVASSGYIYCVGGKSAPSSSSFVDSVYFAQLTSSGVGAWTNTTSYPLKAQSASCVTSSSYVYCVGGYTADSPNNSVGSVFYTRVTSSGVGAWTNTTAYPTPHGQASCAATGG